MKILTFVRVREYIAERFPRVSYFLGSAGTRTALPLAVWASVVAEVAAGVFPAHVLWFAAVALGLIASWRLVVAGYHAAVCPCVLDALDEDEDLAFSPENEEAY
jgi:hypothetical protein